jgi:hypothetical protein
MILDAANKRPECEGLVGVGVVNEDGGRWRLTFNLRSGARVSAGCRSWLGQYVAELQDRYDCELGI